MPYFFSDADDLELNLNLNRESLLTGLDNCRTMMCVPRLWVRTPSFFSLERNQISDLSTLERST